MRSKVRFKNFGSNYHRELIAFFWRLFEIAFKQIGFIMIFPMKKHEQVLWRRTLSEIF